MLQEQATKIFANSSPTASKILMDFVSGYSSTYQAISTSSLVLNSSKITSLDNPDIKELKEEIQVLSVYQKAFNHGLKRKSTSQD